MKGLWRLLGSAAAAAAGAAALAVIARLVEKETVAAAPAEQTARPAELADTMAAASTEVKQAVEGWKNASAQAADEAGQKAPDQAPGQEGETAPPPEEPAQQNAAAPGPEEVPAPSAAPYQPGGPNPNPVLAGPAEAPRRVDGRFDVERIASPEDFGDWEDLGCQG